MGKKKKHKHKLTLGEEILRLVVFSAFFAGIAILIIVLSPGAFDSPHFMGNPRSKYCARAFLLIPEAWETVAACRFFNALPFLFFPAIILLHIGGRALRGDFRG